ncbi:unnamed protein product [Calypogeia fissa]
MASNQWNAVICVAVCLFSVFNMVPSCMAKTKYFDWNITIVNYTRNCATKPILTVNGQYPGPAIYVTEGDRVIVKLTNNAKSNVTIHWHGIRQVGSCWQDGVAYITECPIQPGNYEVYDFVVSEQRGTALWHAHISWIRATVHGAFITQPAKNRYPFPKPCQEETVILGEWWNQDVELVEKQGLDAGASFPLADAMTINGLPGTQYNCSGSEGLAVIDVQQGKTYLLRVINAALNTELFFAIANHSLTVVEIDSNYVKPFTVDKGIVITPGQTVNVLVTANQSPGTYYMVGQSHSTILVTDLSGIPPQGLPLILADVPPIPTTGLFQYQNAPVLVNNQTLYPDLPDIKDTNYSTNFASSLKALHPGTLPLSNNIRHLLYTVGTGTESCTDANPCAPQQGAYRVTGMISNVSFVSPKTAILQAHYYNISGVYLSTFPDSPPKVFDFTAAPSPPPGDQIAEKATRVAEVEFGTVVQLVLQDVNNFAFESHPFHLHGFFFHVLGQGLGDYNATSDLAKFNYYDPPLRFTASLPTRGWVAIRFKADNPGVWFLHCHLEKHLSYGMAAVFIVKDGNQTQQKLPPPKRLNQC